MSFKQAGVLPLVSWHEVEDGNLAQGLVEVMGEADTYTRQAKFSTGAAAPTTIIMRPCLLYSQLRNIVSKTMCHSLPSE